MIRSRLTPLEEAATAPYNTSSQLGPKGPTPIPRSAAEARTRLPWPEQLGNSLPFHAKQEAMAFAGLVSYVMGVTPNDTAEA